MQELVWNQSKDTRAMDPHVIVMDNGNLGGQTD